MEFVTSVLQIISLLSEGATCTNYSCNLEEKLNYLRTALNELKNLRDDIRRRVNIDEARRMTRTHQVNGWLERVEATQSEVEEIIEEGSRQLQRRCLCNFCPRNYLATHKLGKKVFKKLAVVEELKEKGNFNMVSENLIPVPVEALPHSPNMGLESIFEEAWRLLGEVDQVGILGLYGMGGVGKTTLMKKINEEFLKRSHEFAVVIWITVSKQMNVERIQKKIAERLGLSWVDDREQEDQAKYILGALRRKKFVLLLDDIWERVDLESVGIPTPDTRNKSKVVFTTRSEAVCGLMEANKKIKVECLDWDEAWNLFQSKVGEEALNFHPEIPRLAQVVTKECGGLPLALITVGRTMASKTTLKEWKHAITVLKKSASEFSAMGDNVFPLLKFSYDSLPSDTIKSCFLYCSLYPEDWQILKLELIDQWIGEGFMDGFDDLDEARHQGHYIIGILKATCLLESGYVGESTVKMHDVTRDLAMWIASECGRKKDKYVVKAGLGLHGAPEVEKWSNAERLSLMENELEELRGVPNCPNLFTLLLQSNFRLKKVYDGFFQFMPALRVLNLSRTGISELPTEITELVGLRYLNLSGTKIKQLPFGLKNWRKLKFLGLSWTPSLATIPHGEISMLSSLQALNLVNSAFSYWEVKQPDGDGCTPSLVELECLKNLQSLGITIKTVHVLQMLLSSNKLQMCTMYFCIRECRGLTSLTLSPSSPPMPFLSSSTAITASLGKMINLQELEIYNCLPLEELTISRVVGQEESWSLSHLESLVLENLPNVKIIWERSQTVLCFQNLYFLYIKGCCALKDLTWLRHVQSLQILNLINCDEIEEVIHTKVTVIQEELNTFSRLKYIKLSGLPNLKRICRSALTFPSLVWFEVEDCPKLSKLPLDSMSAKNTLKWIKGEQEWWDMLEWEDGTIKSIFQHKYRKR